MNAARRSALALCALAWIGCSRAAGETSPPLRPAPDLALDLVLREPTVAQPVFLDFDERGRLWVVQYRQYPHPAGLKAQSRDQFWRTVYDRAKPPPPYDAPEKAAFRGRDRITIHEDVRGDGSFASTRVFLDGLNITTAVCRGRGGVWVLSPPHLLFYPEANDDDAPDGPPAVVLDGFGIQDSHAMANSLRWGPDGWLYGAQGSTVTSDIVRPGLDRTPVARILGQCIWRYHPESRRFEVFAEGGGNAFCVEIDDKGRIFSGHNGLEGRGFHYVQGAYYLKGFEKHGALSNPHAFGYFRPMPHPPIQRFSHALLIYEADALPACYRGRMLPIDPVNGHLPLTELVPQGATFATRDLGSVLQSEDKHFRPVDIKLGPEGAIYLADWRDLEIAHTENEHSGQHDGRIYRLRAAAAVAAPGRLPDLRKLSSPALVEELRQPNRWRRQTALRLIGDRRDPALVATLRSVLRENQGGQFALEALWALQLSGGFDETIARELFAHRDPFVRLWSVRLIGDRGDVARETADALAELARREENVEVRSQLAASAKRLPAAVALPLIRGLLGHDADAGDPYLPLQIWWAVERHCVADRAAVLALFSGETWQRPLVAQHLGARLMRRFAAGGTSDDWLACTRLLDAAPDGACRAALLDGFEQAFAGRAVPELPAELAQAMRRAGGGSLTLRIRRGDAAAVQEAEKIMLDPRQPAAERERLVALFGEVPRPAVVPVLLRLLADESPGVRRAALRASAAYDAPELMRTLVAGFEKLSAEERDIAQSVLTSRPSGARALLDAVQAGVIDASAIHPPMRDKMKLLSGGELAARVERVFGAPTAPAPEHLRAEIARVRAVLEQGAGDPDRGRAIYEQLCAACHKLHGEGGELGPDLTAFKRDDVERMLVNVINPSAEIREGYEMLVVTRRDGTVNTGFLAAEDQNRIELRDMAGVAVAIPRAVISRTLPAGRSLMPEGLLTGKSDAEVRDLFAYLRTAQRPPAAGADPK